MAKRIPVYLFTGFLEGGKTHIIQESLEDKKFNSGEKTLLLVCEEGIDEYEPELFWGQNVYLHIIEDESELNPAALSELEKKYRIDRVIIEYNGMWQLGTLYENLPENWAIFQNMMFAEAATFINYNANMRSLVYDKLRDCEMIVLNRASESTDKEEIHKIVRSVNTRTLITYDYPDGHIEYDEIEDPLPFDVDAPVIEIGDDDFAVWYRDMVEDLEKYRGKTVKFKGIAARDASLGDDEIILGRHVMTCCADDIAYYGFACKFRYKTGIKNGEWITMTAKISLEKHKLYPQAGPVMNVITTEFSQKPQREVATF